MRSITMRSKQLSVMVLSLFLINQTALAFDPQWSKIKSDSTSSVAEPEARRRHVFHDVQCHNKPFTKFFAKGLKSAYQLANTLRDQGTAAGTTQGNTDGAAAAAALTAEQGTTDGTNSG